MWQRIIDPLAKNFHVVSVHLPGFGESDCPSELFTTDRYADFLCDLLDRFNLKSTSLLGISYGGQIAATLAHKHPKRVYKLVLIASTGLGDHPLLKRKFAWKIVAGCAKHIVLRSEWLMCLFGRLSFYDAKSRPIDLCRKFHEQISGDGKADAWLSVLWNVVAVGSEFRQKLQSLCVPTMIVWGNHDRILRPRLAEEFHQLIPNSTVKVLDECGHSVPLERVEEVSGEITRFVLRR